MGFLCDSPAVLGAEPHGGGHAGVVLALFTSVLRLRRLRCFLFGLTSVWTDGMLDYLFQSEKDNAFKRLAPTCRRRPVDEAGGR